MLFTISALLFLGLITAIQIVWGWWRHWRSSTDLRAIAEEKLAAERKLADDRRRAERYQVDQRLQQTNQRMQQALLQLEEAPDFRRAAQFAKLAAQLPVTFRQRQFKRFRHKLVQHFAARLSSGDEARGLHLPLAELVQALGVAKFEADYIEAEAQQLLARPALRQERTFARALDTLQQEHLRRKEVLASLEAISPELREQLDEAEENRFREAVFQLQRDPEIRSPVAPVVKESES